MNKKIAAIATITFNGVWYISRLNTNETLSNDRGRRVIYSVLENLKNKGIDSVLTLDKNTEIVKKGDNAVSVRVYA